jgi:type IV secretory pathway VirB10-like protein
MAAAPKLQPAPPKPPRSNARFWLVAGIAGAVVLMGALIAAVYFYQESQAANIDKLNKGLLGLGGDAPSENGNRRSLARLPTELPEGEPASQTVLPDPASPPAPPAPPDLPPPTTPEQATAQVARDPVPGTQAPAQPVQREPLMYRGKKRSEVAQVSARPGADQYPVNPYARQEPTARSAAGAMPQARNGREVFAQTAGRGQGLYASDEMVDPPAGMCVSTPHNIWDLQFQGEVHTQFGSEFTVHVLQDVPGRIYDGVSSQPCEFPLIPAGTQVACVPNTIDVGRGDKFVQAVCSRVDFPGGKSMPLDGWSLVGPSRSAGVPGSSRYPWGDIFASAVVDIIGAIPGAFVAAAGSLSGPAGVAINIGSDRFQESTRQYGQSEFKRVPTLYIPRGAPAGLRQIGSLALPDEPR